MNTSKLKEIAAAKQKLAALESEAASELKTELAALPARYGFSDTRAFVLAVRRACAGTKLTKLANGRKARAIITPDMRGAVKTMVQSGHSGAYIANEVGISLPSVQNIKKALGLVKARK